MSRINISVLNNRKIYNLKRLLSRKDVEEKTVEQVRQENPILYFNNGNKKNESAEITDQRLVKKILNLVGKDLAELKNLLVGSMWDECNGKWWNQFTIRTYDETPVIGNTFFHSTGQPEYDYMIDEIINLINKEV